MTAAARESSLVTKRRALHRAGAVLADNARDPVLRAAQASFAFAWLADWAVTVGIGIVAYRDAGSLGVGLIGVARMLPAAVIAPFASALADRVRRERVLFAVSACRAVLFAGIAGLVATDVLGMQPVVPVLGRGTARLHESARSAVAGLGDRSPEAAHRAVRGVLESGRSAGPCA